MISISSMILGCLASLFAVNSAGNLKGAWNKSVDSYKANSFFSPEAKKGLDVADKFAKTGGFGLLAIQSFTQDKVPTVALQSVLNVVEGKLPKTGKQLKQTITKVGDDAKSIFKNNKSEKKIDKIEPSNKNYTTQLTGMKLSRQMAESANTKTSGPGTNYNELEKKEMVTVPESYDKTMEEKTTMIKLENTDDERRITFEQS